MAAAALTAGCWSLYAPDDAPEVNPPRTVSVTVQYRQPQGCVNEVAPCNEPVVFFGSWMHPGQEFQLTLDSGSYIWRGTARGVPVNYPPRDQAHLVRIFDPHLREGPGGGVTAAAPVGGRASSWTSSTAPAERTRAALVYIDENGLGHDPFF